MRINKKSFNKKNLTIKSILVAQIEEKNTFWDTSTKPNIGILLKSVRLGASTNPPIHNLIHYFFIKMAFAMACPNFKKGLKMAFSPLRVNEV
jgi:hypothetical protein